MGAKLFAGVATGRDRNCVCADGSSACDVVRRIADDEHVGRPKSDSVMFSRPTQGMRAQVVPVFRIVGKGPKSEVLPQIELSELDLSSAPQIAGKQSLSDKPALSDRIDDRADAGQYAGVWSVYFLCERAQIGIEKDLDISRCRGAEVFHQYRPRYPDVRTPEVFEPGKVVLNAKRTLKGEPQRAFAGAAGIDQGAINVPEKKRFHDKRLCSPAGVPLASLTRILKIVP